MSVSLAEVRKKSKRHNYEDNRRTMFFSSRVSVYFTYLFARAGLSADAATLAFALAGLAACALAYLPLAYSPMLAFLAYRLHVILDVVDGEVARFRGTASPAGAYADFVTHYFVYTHIGFACGMNAFFTGGRIIDIVLGFLISFGLVMNLAAKDCWYRANFGKGSRVEAQRPLWRGAGPTLLAARLAGVNCFFALYALASLAACWFPGLDLRTPVLGLFAGWLPLFSLARIAVTARFGKIPRRAAWYR